MPSPQGDGRRPVPRPPRPARPPRTTSMFNNKSALVLHAWKRSRVTGDYACGGREVFGPSAQWSLWYAHHITRRVFPATSTAAPPASPPLASPRRVLRGSRDGCPPPLEDEHLAGAANPRTWATKKLDAPDTHEIKKTKNTNRNNNGCTSIKETI